MSWRHIFRAGVFGGLLALASVAQADAMQELIAAAQADLEQGNADAAYQRLADAQTEHAGRVEFDYWLGLAAVRAGKPGEGSFALERVILENPRHAGARLELATAYLQLGQRDAAEMELAALESMNPPAQAQERIDALNEALDRQAAVAQRRFGGYVGVEAGSDDNVGAWPDGFELVPGFALASIDSPFYSLKGGYWHNFQPAADQKIVFNLDGLFRRNSEDEAEQFNQDYMSARGEWIKDLDGRRAVSLAADIGKLNLDGEDYYAQYGINGQYRMAVSDISRFTAGVEIRQLDFELDQYDYLLVRLLGQIKHAPSADWDLTLALTADQELADDLRAGGDATVIGFTGTGWYSISSKHRAGAMIGYAHAAYDEDYTAGQAVSAETGPRDDDRLNAGLMYDWFPGQRWQVRGQATYRDQSSSLDAFNYDQTVLSAGLNYFF